MEQMILIIFRLSDRYYYLKTHKHALFQARH